MHEYAIMKEVVESILKEASRHYAKRISEVHLALGKLLFIGSDEASFAYEALVKDTSMENSKLYIEEIDPKVRCPSCGYEGEVKIGGEAHLHIPVPINCPKCGGPVQILEGKECIIKSFKIEV